VQVERARAAPSPPRPCGHPVPPALHRVAQLAGQDARAVQADGARPLRPARRGQEVEPVLLRPPQVVRPGDRPRPCRGLPEQGHEIGVAGDGQVVVQPVRVRQGEDIAGAARGGRPGVGRSRPPLPRPRRGHSPSLRAGLSSSSRARRT
jgi:hypothetical protein